MKKLLTVILSVLVAFSGIALVLQSIEREPQMTIDAFSEAVATLNETYRDQPAANRLIVTTKKHVDLLDSVDSVEGYGDLHILQFNSESAAEGAKNYYTREYGDEAVDEDEILYAAEETDRAPDGVYFFDNDDEDGAAYYDGHNSWGSSYRR